MPLPLLFVGGLAAVAGIKAVVGLVNKSAELSRTYELTTSGGRDAADMKGNLVTRTFMLEEQELMALAKCKSETACSDVLDVAEERASALAPMLVVMKQATQCGGCGSIHATEE